MRVYKNENLSGETRTPTPLYNTPYELIKLEKWQNICNELRRLYILGCPVKTEIIDTL